MEPDSTSAKDQIYFHSNESAETLSSPDDIFNVCFICKALDTEINVIENRRQADTYSLLKVKFSCCVSHAIDSVTFTAK